MTRLKTLAWSSVGKKLMTGATGLGLFVFVILHLLGNLTLLIGADAFNRYAHFLETLFHGWFRYAVEIGLLLVFLFHIAYGTSVALFDKQRARPVPYRRRARAGGTSRLTLSSRSMIVTGLVLLVFVIIHLRMFRFAQTRSIPLENGERMRDLYTLVVVSFKNLWITLGYAAVMLLLGLHLRHGVWSAFQSLGWSHARLMPFLQGAALVFAAALAVGFLFLPLYLYLFAEAPAAGLARMGGP